MSVLQRLQSSPAQFRKRLIIDVDGSSRQLADSIDKWQQRDFQALDSSWQRVTTGQNTEGPKSAWLERPRGHSKTTDLAVMATWCLFASKRQLNGYAAAADKDQARLLRDAINKLVMLNPWLQSILKVDSMRVTNLRTSSTLDVLTADAPSSYGLTPDFVVLDEIVHWPRRDLWDSLFSASAKKEHCFMVVITNAGFTESWQHELRENIRRNDNWYFSRLKGPQASWITGKRLDEQARLLPRIAFERLWKNLWTSGSGDALEPDDIEKAITLDGPMRKAEPRLVYIAGLDLGLRKDASALITIGVDAGWIEEKQKRKRRLNSTAEAMIDLGLLDEPDDDTEEIHHQGTGKIKLASVDIWEPKENRVSIDEIEQRILELDKRFQYQCVAVDPWQAALLCERLRKQGIPTEGVDPKPQNLRGMASAVLEVFQENTIEVYNEPKLLADLRALRVEERSYGVRLVPGRTEQGTRHGDAATGLALALFTARNKIDLANRSVSDIIVA